MKKKILCTFADRRMNKTLDRLKLQAIKINFFDEIKIFNESHLDRTFKKKFSNLLKPNVRGFGYWVWKPQIIKQMLNSISEGDLLLYLDAGCHLNSKGVKKLSDYFSRLEKSKNFILATELEKEYQEKFWTKGDVFDYFDERCNRSIINSPQIQAGVIFIKKTDKALNFVDEWLKVYETNTSLVDDAPSISNNFEGFKENRHDQSVFSILCKRTGVELIPNFDIYRHGDWSQMDLYPVWAMRDKKIHRPIWFRIFDKAKLKLKKIINGNPPTG